MSQTPASDDLTQLLTQSAWARRLARALVSAGDADDLCQEAWLKAVEQRSVDQPRAWLATVLRNLAHNHRRARDRRQQRESEGAAGEALPTPEQSLGRVEIQRVLSERVAALEEPFRQTVLLRFFDELPAAEIAVRLGVPAGTIRWRLKMAIERLREDLDVRRPEWRRDWALVVVPGGLGAGVQAAAGAPHRCTPSRQTDLGAGTSSVGAGGSAGVATFPVLVASLVVLGGAGIVLAVHALASAPALQSLPAPAQLHSRSSSLSAANANANANANAVAVTVAGANAVADDPPPPGDPTFVPFEQLPPRLIQAFVAAQDRRFFKHDGVDLHAMARALFADIHAGRVEQGGSTITQQLAKQTLGEERSFGRKLRQVMLAHELERSYSKEEILTLYLNRVFLGHGSYGVAAAARRYFDKPVSQLDVAECALLAAQPHAPAHTSPLAHPDAARDARNRVLDGMVTTEALTRAEADHWSAQPVVVSLR